MAFRQPAHHVEPEAGGVGEVQLGPVDDPVVRRGQVLLAHAEAPVLDLDGEPVGDQLATDLDGRVWRGERQAVLDQLGEQVDDVADRATGERDRPERQHVDPGVVLHLGHGAAHHVDHRDVAPPGPTGGGTGEHDQVFRVAPHPGGQVVDPEQVLQLLRVVFAALHRVEQGELAVDERLRASGQAQEDLADVATQVGLLDGGPQRGLLDGVERLADLADLVGAELQRGRLGGHVDLLAAPEPLHHPGQPLVGELPGGLPQPVQLAQQVPGRGDGDDDRGDDGEQAQTGGEHQSDDDHHGHAGGPVHDALAASGDDAVHLGQHRLDSAPPLLGADRQLGRRPALADDAVLHGAQSGERLALDELLVTALVGVGEPYPGLLTEEPLRADQRDVAGVLGAAHPTVAEEAAEQRVLLGDQLLHPVELDQGRRLAGDLLVVQAARHVVDLEDRLDRAGVRLSGGDPVDLAVQHLRAGLLQRVDLGDRHTELGVQCGTAGDVDLPVAHRGGEVGGQLGGLALLGLERCPLRGLGVAQVRLGQPPLHLELLQQRLARCVDLAVEQLDTEQVEAVAQGHPRREHPERDQGEQQGDNLGADTRTARTH
ncbi:hypothetical protein PSN01_03378 [Micromonospora saelicesensis]|nr:hypothetical protein PSN01_03378 [Micromonospora saelicesensis]